LADPSLFFRLPFLTLISIETFQRIVLPGILKLAHTIADLVESEEIHSAHLAEALHVLRLA